MAKIFSSTTILLLFVSQLAYSQWTGSTTPTGSIVRAGSVGIGDYFTGTNVPISPYSLEVRSNVNSVMRIYAPANQAPGSGNPSVYAGLVVESSVQRGAFKVGYPWGLGIGSETNNDFNLVSNSIVRLSVKNNGNIGIGTTSPLSLFHVNGLSTFSGNIVVPSAKLGVGTSSPSTPLHVVGASTLSGNLNVTGVSTLSGNTYLLNGNVGIGTSAPGSFKLAVEGKIGAREVNVIATTPWPDYVFSPNYELISLEELSSYLRINRHLPGVPSAATIEQEGVNLGEMNATLLKKVEELTLYVIELKSELEKLKSEQATLKTGK